MVAQRTFSEFMEICEAKVPVTRQAGDFRYSGRTGEEKAERRANVLSKSSDPARRRQANTIRSRIKTVEIVILQEQVLMQDKTFIVDNKEERMILLSS
jgi:hypothetical protein